MGSDGWEDIADGKSHVSETLFVAGEDEEDMRALEEDMRTLDPSPAYEDAVAPLPPPRLRVIGATWGGVNVTTEVAAMVRADETINLNMRTLHRDLVPDPANGVVKVLSVLYQYEGETEGDDQLRLLNVSEYSPSAKVQISSAAQENWSTSGLSSHFMTLDRETTWRDGQVEIIAVLYGPKRIRTPSVLEELAQFFEGRRGQIRMTNSFFCTDTWAGYRKSWTVYFRFLNSKRIQCVTGNEGGALEVPWTRD